MSRRRRRRGSNPTATAGKRVIIVGGSFAGLTLARALQHLSTPENFEVTVLEAESPSRHTERENGEVNLHGLDKVLLKDLGLSSLCTDLVRYPSRPKYVQRREILSGLASSLKPETIRYSSCVSAMAESEESDEGGSIVLTVECEPGEDEDANGCDRELLACDFVVLAYGLTAVTASLVPLSLAANVVLIGDARVQFGYEAFFGWQRFNYGASISMSDGLRLAKLLVAKTNTTAEMSQERADAIALRQKLAEVVRELSIFSVERWKRTRQLRRVLIPMVLFLLVILVLARLFRAQRHSPS